MFRNWTNCTILLTAASLLIIAPSPQAGAEEPSFKITMDPIIFEGNYLDQDTDSSRSQEYRDLSDGFRLTQLNLRGLSSDLKRELRFQVLNGGKDDAFYGLTYDVGGAWRLELSYDNIPHRFGNNGLTLWTLKTPGSWEIQDPVQQALQGAIADQAAINRGGINFAFLNGLIQPFLSVANEVDVALQRRRTKARLELGSAAAGDWALEYRHEARNGLRAYGTSFGFNNVTELPEPISYDTTDAILSGTWKWDSGIATVGYRYSKFENEISTLVWDNPWRATDASDGAAYLAPSGSSIGGSSRGFVDLAPDSDASAFFANGRFDLTENSWLQAAVTYGKQKQDDPLLPFTLNTAINTSVGAPFDASDPANQVIGSADRKSTTSRLALDYGLRLDGGWQVGARYSYLDYEDDSERLEFPGYVRYHAVWEDIGRITVPYNWTKETISANVDKDLGDFGTVGLQIRRDTADREFRETEETTEDIIALSWDAHLGPTMLRAKYETGSRDIKGEYLTEAQEATFEEPEGINNQPGLRKFSQAARDIDRWKLSLNFPFADVWGLDVFLQGANYDYTESEFGLTSDEIIRYGFELSRSAGDFGTFFLLAERADRDVSQAGRQSGGSLSTDPRADWFIDLNEINDVYGIGWAREAKNWQADLRAQQVKSDGTADIFSPPGGTPDLGVGFDNYEDYERFSVEGTYDYDITKNVALGVRVLYEDYTIDSFIRQNLRNYLPGALLLFANDGDYEVLSLGVRMSFRL
ncbi:MAG: MtrB/PioB family outer membrane beta-barrel protein [Acidobacteria bacterium]|nr:MtrB/PioB family outer membrane beta-barrel protein [Acidobacteriota bacterium]